MQLFEARFIIFAGAMLFAASCVMNTKMSFDYAG
jgi:hypothetical protein